MYLTFNKTLNTRHLCLPEPTIQLVYRNTCNTDTFKPFGGRYIKFHPRRSTNLCFQWVGSSGGIIYEGSVGSDGWFGRLGGAPNKWKIGKRLFLDFILDGDSIKLCRIYLSKCFWFHVFFYLEIRKPKHKYYEVQLRKSS